MGLLHTLKSKLRSSEQAENEEGFTLIELVIVVAIIGILSAIAVPTFGTIQENTRHASGETTAKNTYAALVSSAMGVGASLTPDEILSNASNGEVTVSDNDGWSNEHNLCVTVVWVDTPSSTQNYGPGCP